MKLANIMLRLESWLKYLESHAWKLNLDSRKKEFTLI